MTPTDKYVFRTRIWTNDVHQLTCEHDPRCRLDMSPTQDAYPGLELFDHEPMWQPALGAPEGDKPYQRWLWSQTSLDTLKEDEKGTIPIWKMFSATVVSRTRLARFATID